MILFFRYLTWKNTFRAKPSTNKQVQLRKICSICEALNSPLDKWPEKSYPHIQDWWRGTAENRWIHLYLHTHLDIMVQRWLWINITNLLYLISRHCKASMEEYSTGLVFGFSSNFEKRVEKFYSVIFVIVLLLALICFAFTLTKACWLFSGVISSTFGISGI